MFLRVERRQFMTAIHTTLRTRGRNSFERISVKAAANEITCTLTFSCTTPATAEANGIALHCTGGPVGPVATSNPAGGFEIGTKLKSKLPS